MSKLANKTKLLFIGACYGAMVSLPVAADDTEIYVNTSVIDPSIQPNVMFLLDTSLSMGKDLPVLEPYDATIDYDTLPPNAGSPCFDDSLVYRMSGEVSKKAKQFCNGNPSGDIFPASNGGKGHVQGTAKITKFHCANAAMISGGAEPPTSTGFYLGRVQKYRDNNGSNKVQWREFSRSNPDSVVDCGADQGIHGQTSAGPKFSTKLKDQASAWTSVAVDAYEWAGVSVNAFYTGNYLNYLQTAPSTTTYRIELIRDVMRDFIASTTGINLGFMPFSQKKSTGSHSGSLGGMVEVAMDDIEVTRAAIDDRLVFYGIQHDPLDTGLKSGHDNLVLGTPLSQQYYEAMRYFQGGAVHYGLEADPAPSISDSLMSGSAADPLPSGTLYKSPIISECQKNYIVVLTDGQPYRDPMNASQLSSMGVTAAGIAECENQCTTGGCSTSNCLDHLAFSAGSFDQSSAIDGDQVISTFTIAFGSDIGILNDASAASRAATGEGLSLVANDASELSSHLKKVFADILDKEYTFSSPAVSVNAFNRTVHLNDLYFTLFKPDNGPRWVGNLKKYQLAFKTDPLDAAKKIPFIADANGDEAINLSTGGFEETAVSFWTDVDAIGSDGNKVGPDGKIVREGGALSTMTLGRKITTVTDIYTNNGGVFVPSTKALSSSINRVDVGNLDLSETLLGIDGFTGIVTGIPYRTTLINWSNGIDVFDEDDDGATTDAFASMADPLHSEPALVQYGEVAGVADLVAYVATNDGYLHAIDVDNGNELFSFIPQELLANLTISMENSGSDKLYGLDGNVVAWVNDVDGNGSIDGSDHVYLYISMRRGGKNIYALDVTDRNDPQLMWVIKGGVGDYVELGDTWSSINVEKIMDGTDAKTVLVFGGGYDDSQDTVAVRSTDAIGRAVFIAHATTGKRLWIGSDGGDTSISEMDYSIPARIKPLDISGDGFIDRLYAADMGGQIFRFDIDNTNGAPLASSITGGRIADLAGSADVDARRFYYPPDVALVDDPSGKYHGMVIASGFRANPLNKVIRDRIYMLKDKHTGRITSASDYAVLTNASLQNVTDNLAGGDGADDVARDAELANIASAEGWYIDLDDGAGGWVGEKGLSEPLLIEGVAIVSTYVPDTAVAVGSCSPNEGGGKVYFLDIIDATPAFPAGVDKRPQRHIELKRGGIPPSPNVIITTDKVPTLCVGTECQNADFDLGIRKTFWYEVEN